MAVGGARSDVAAAALARNLALQAAGYGDLRVPQCELDGYRDKTARLAFLSCAGARFTKSDRSMVLLNRGQYGGWWAVVDDNCLPGKWATRAGALAAARKAERDAAAASRAKQAQDAAIRQAMSEPLPEIPPLDTSLACLHAMRTSARRAMLADTVEHQERARHDWSYEWYRGL